MTKFWIKFYIDTLDEPKLARMSDHLWRRQMELSLMAGKQGQDGALPPLEDIAWKLHVSDDDALADLHSLAKLGLIFETESGKWFVTDYQEKQTSESTERVKHYRGRDVIRNVSENVVHNVSDNVTRNAGGIVSCNADDNVSCNAGESVSSNAGENVPCNAHEIVSCNENVTAGDSNSNSISISDYISDSQEEERVQGEGKPLAILAQAGETWAVPENPAEAMEHPDVLVYTAATGRIPGLSQYRTAIETVRFLRAREKLDDRGLAGYLMPYWLAWSSRKRLDGRSYDPGNITWLTEWALNRSIPPPGGQKASDSARSAAPSVEQTRRMLAEKDKTLKKAVPPPQDVLDKIHNLKKQLDGRKHADGEKMDQDGPPHRGASPPDR